MTNSRETQSEPVEGQDEAIKRRAEEIKPLLRATETKHVLARYTLGECVNELESTHGDHTVEKLASALGRGYGPDNLRTFARIARRWTKPEFEALAERGLDISDFRELAKLPDDATRASIEQQAIENSWPIEVLKKEVREANGQGQSRARTKQAAHVHHDVPVMNVTDALNALITGKQARVDEQARLREKLDRIDPRAAQALASEITKAIEAVQAQRAALKETELMLITALQLSCGAAA